MVQDLCFFLEQARRAHRRHRHHHADRARHAGDRRRRRLRAVRGPDRGDVACSPRRSSPTPRSPSGGCRSSSSRSSSRCSRRWASATSAARSTSPPTSTPGWSTSPPGTPTLHSPIDKIHPMPFPGLNIDNLPFFAVIAAVAEGQTLLHDWVYENRAIYLTELTKLGASVKLLDPHRVMIEGPTRWSRHRDDLPAGAAPGGGHPAGDAGRRRAPRCCARSTSSTAATRTSPPGSTPSAPASRPSATSCSATLASKGTSVLRSVDVIDRGYEDLATRLNALGRQHRDRPRHLTPGRASGPRSAEEGLDVGAGDRPGRRRRGHVGGDPRQRHASWGRCRGASRSRPRSGCRGRRARGRRPGTTSTGGR